MTALTVALALVRDKLLLATAALERGDVAGARAEFSAASAALEEAIGGLRSDEVAA